MKKVLITGPSGSGKTYISKYFRKQELNAIDADMIEGLGEWYDHEGNVIAFPENAGKDFFSNHPFLWNESLLIKLLNQQNQDTYLFGFAGNVFDCLKYFDKVYYLDIPAKTILRRMGVHDRDNPKGMGKTEEQRQITVEYVDSHLRPKALNEGITFIDATMSPHKLLNIIK